MKGCDRMRGASLLPVRTDIKAEKMSHTAVLEGRHYGLNVCPPKLICWNNEAPGDAIRRRGLRS